MYFDNTIVFEIIKHYHVFMRALKTIHGVIGFKDRFYLEVLTNWEKRRFKVEGRSQYLAQVYGELII